jgi:hypothetical protein
MTIFSSELLGWNFLSSRFLIGTYYGILATLPLAPSQLLSIRALLLEDENKQGKIAGSGAAKGIFIAGVSGFLIAQFAMFLSIYCFPLYQLWFKPHLFNLLLPPFLLWHYFKIIEFDPVAHLVPNYKYPLLDPRVRTAFIESFLLQIINPIVLPNPVFTRLMSIFLFRYSNIPIFIFGSLIGWFSGQLLFIKLSSILLSRLQLDSPAIYRIVKRIVHWAFPPIIMGIFLSYIGRVSMVPLDQKINKKKILPYHLWPDICYNRDRISRFTHFMLSSHQSKFRYQTNAPFNTLNVTLHKNHFSQYFFQTCVSDGKKRLSHNYPISISLIQNDLKNMMKLSQDKYMLEKEWFKDKETRLLRFNNMMNNKFHHLDTMMDTVLEKRLHSINERGLKIFNLLKYIDNNTTYSSEFSKSIRKYIQSYHLLGNRVKKNYDMRLGNNLRKQPNLVKHESPWLNNQKKSYEISSKITRNYVTRWKINDKRLNRLKKIISKLNINNFYFDLYKVLPVWKSRSNFSSFYHEFDILKKNIKRTKRNKFFTRSLVPGATFGRSRNTAGMFFQFLETKPRSSFFLRAKEIIIDSKKNLDLQQRVSQTEAEKFDFSSSHSVRGPALIIQAFIRKYIKLPILIFGKSLVRLVLMHTSEWNEDWAEWSQEKYVYCYYNGNYVPGNQMPPHWLGDGLQIQILSPFYLTPWRPSLYNKDILLRTKNLLSLKATYINIWGQETDVPFGEVQYTPFFKPIVKGSIIFSRYQLGRILRIINQMWLTFCKQYSFVQSTFYNKIKIFDKQTPRNTFDLTKNDTKSFFEKQIISDKFNYLPDKLENEHEDISLIEIGIKKQQIAEDKIYIPNLNKSDTKIQITQEIENTKSVSLTQNIASNSELIGVNNDIFIYKDHHSLIKESVRYNQLSIFPNTFIFQKKTKFVKYQIMKVKIFFLRLYQNLIDTRKLIFRLIMNLIRKFQITIFQHKKNMIFVLTRMISKNQKNIYLLKKNVIFFLNNNILLSRKMNNYKDSINYSINYAKDNIYLSHAYILHKIWQNNFPNRLPIQKMFINWEANSVLKSDIQIILNEYGFLQNHPKDISVNNFKEWLSPFRRYTSSPEVWNQISPNTWRDSVNKFWVKNPLFINNFKYKRKIDTDKSSHYLSYFKPLFEKSNKMTKRWQINLLINSYTNSLKNDHLHDLLRGWQTQNRQNLQLFHRNLIYNNLNRKSHILTSKPLTWGLANIRNNGLVVSFALIRSFHGSFTSKANNFIYNKQPIYIKYKTRFRKQKENQFATFKKRVSFRPIIQYKWKFEQDRFKVLDKINIISKVKSDLNNAIKNAMLAKQNKAKSLFTFEEKIKETTLQWKTLNLSKFTCQTIKKRQAKIVDDEMLMHTIISSFLKVKTKYLNIQNLVLLNSSLNQLFLTDTFLPKYSLVTPEDLLLAKTLREYRILSSFQFISQNKTDEFNEMRNLIQFQIQKLEHPNNIDITSCSNPSLLKTYQKLSSHQLIKRYLWPSYRVEDLACMNRYWINTANQARFSNLRIRIYPNLGK